MGKSFFVGTLEVSPPRIVGVDSWTPPGPQANAPSASLKLHEIAEGRTIHLSWAWSGESSFETVKAVLYRSTTDPGTSELDPIGYPVTILRSIPHECPGSYDDDQTADGVRYFYQLKVGDASGKVRFSNVVEAETPRLALTRMSAPSIFIDKQDYYLEMRDGERPVKRFPVALGRNPMKRKLHQDNASTPEGFFTVVGVQPKATYYRAYDVSYPTDIDEMRYTFAADHGLLPRRDNGVPDIGGDIQIHGRGIQNNWTFGCIALRNEDMDELFAHPEIKAGVSISIVGYELTREDLQAITSCDVLSLQQRLKDSGFNPGPVNGRIGPQLNAALGEFQLRERLPVTCQPDSRTLRLLQASR